MIAAVKEFELTLTTRNNLLKSRRLALGLSNAELARAAGIGAGQYGKLEALKTSPLDQRYGRCDWKPIVKRLAAYHGVAPSDLFPESVIAIKEPVAVVELDAAAAKALTLVRFDGDPQRAMETIEQSEQVARAVSLLPPGRAEVLRMRFGLDGEESQTLDQVGKAIGLSRERVRQIEMRAMAEVRKSIRREQGGENP